MAGAAAAPADDDAGSARGLLHRARRLLWAAVVPLIALVLVLAAWQAWTEWRRVLEVGRAEAQARRAAVDGLARDAVHHVADLQRWMQQAYLDGDRPADPGIAQSLQPNVDAQGRPDGYTLDSLPEALRPGMAQVLWPEGNGPAAGALRRAEALSAVIEIAQQRHTWIASSFFLAEPDRHLLLMPWLPARRVVADSGRSTLTLALQAWHDDDRVRLALPEANPTRQAFWTAPRADADGRGPLVTHAAPVVVADEVRGVVGADLRVPALQALLAAPAGSPWQAWLVDARGQVVVARPDVADGEAAGHVLPDVVTPAVLARALAATGAVQPAAHWQVAALHLRDAPWTLVLAAPRSDLLLATLPRVLPYSLIVLGLLALWLATHALLRSRLVEPLLQTFDYLQRLSADPATPEPLLDRRWQPWVRRVTQTFATMRRAQQAERRAEALKSAIVDHAQTAVLVSDADDRIVELNAAAEQLVGLPREQAVGSTVSELLCPPRHRAAWALARQRMRDGQAPELLGRRLERRLQRADGTELSVEAVVWMTEVDGTAYFTATLSDLTEARAAAEVIARQRDALRQSEKLSAMGALLASVAHELNNPLAIVVGRAGLLEEGLAGHPQQDNARRVLAAAERCGRIVRTFLGMARNRPAHHAPMQLNDVVRGAADMLGYSLRSHDITLELRLDPTLPDVWADADQVGQVVLNLMVNAQQALATHDAPRCITVSTASADDQSVQLSVADNGPGIPPKQRSRLFEPYFTTKPEGIGTGIGLSLSQGIAQEHGGSLTLAPSAPGGGANFVLRLPRRPMAGSAASSGPASSSPSTEAQRGHHHTHA